MRPADSNLRQGICSYEEPKAADDNGVEDGMIKAEQRSAQHVIPGCNQLGST